MSETVTISWRRGMAMEKDQPGLFSQLIAKAAGIDPGARIYIKPDVLEAVKAAWKPSGSHPIISGQAVIAPVPRKQWPEWVHKIAEYASDDDKGVGDTVAREIGDFASAAFETWYRAIFGHVCGCKGRRYEWNLQYPYGRAG